MDDNNNNNLDEPIDSITVDSTPNKPDAGKGVAIASLVLGIISVVTWFLGIGAIIGLITGIIGLICASSAKKAGFMGGIRTGGFVCSIIGVIGSAIVLVACVACVGVLGSTVPATSKIASDEITSAIESVVDNSENEDKNTKTSSDLKETLDDYEDFVDDYVDFMKKYKEDPTDLDLLSEYSDMMSEYTDFANKISKLDTSDMSKEDADYYLEVTTRCSKKLLEVAK